MVAQTTAGTPSTSFIHGSIKRESTTLCEFTVRCIIDMDYLGMGEFDNGNESCSSGTTAASINSEEQRIG